MHITVCIPAHLSHSHLLCHTLAGFRDQSISDFSVSVAWDGAKPDDMLGMCLTKKTNLPERNSVRNLAAFQARLKDIPSDEHYLWFWDSDFLPDPHLIAHAYALLAKDPTLALSPVLVGLRATPGFWEIVGTHHNPPQFGVVANQWSGFASEYRAGDPAISEISVTEGFPLVRADVFVALNGFDESYIGWGANKEELVTRLNASGVPYRLIKSARGYHQPHLPCNERDGALTAINQARHDVLRGNPLSSEKRAYIQTLLEK